MLRGIRFYDDKDFSGCSIFGMMNIRGARFNGEPMITAMTRSVFPAFFSTGGRKV